MVLSDVPTNADDEPGEARETGSELAGYTQGEVLGRGGMGEVVLAHDQRIGRNVALKRMRDHAPSDDALTRFLREARIQARLEHPAIVPVYELGEASDGSPYFTMKRLAGVTLSELLARSALDLKGMLRALVDVCLAIEFAHTRSVVHRDLKPANIMLGDFGEVYVLDWGLARVLTVAAAAAAAGATAAPLGDAEGTEIASLDGETQIGAVLGTPGYMPPEQIDSSQVGPPADVYALGAILFEILAGEPLHPRTAAIANTVMQPTQSPVVRRPDRAIAPELEAACLAALSAEPMQRPSARELGHRIQRYLDGDRDLERRRTLAIESVVVAQAAVASGDAGQRATAMQAAGRALALDPESQDAAALVGTLMLEVPPELPRELREHLDAADVELNVRAASSTVYALLAILLFLPFLGWVGVKSWPMIAAMIGTIVALAAFSYWMVRTRRFNFVVFMFAFAVLMVLFSRLFGPFVLVPGMLGVSSAALIAQPDFEDRPWFPVVVALLAMLCPLALEALGVFGPSWTMRDDQLVIGSGALHLDGAGAMTMLILGNIALVVVNGVYAHTLAASRRIATRKLEIQAWHLRKLLPGDAPVPHLATRREPHPPTHHG